MYWCVLDVCQGVLPFAWSLTHEMVRRAVRGATDGVMGVAVGKSGTVTKARYRFDVDGKADAFALWHKVDGLMRRCGGVCRMRWCNGDDPLSDAGEGNVDGVVDKSGDRDWICGNWSEAGDVMDALAM